MAPGVATRVQAGQSWKRFLASAARAGFAPTRTNALHWISWAVTLALLLGMTAVLSDGRVYSWEEDVTRWAQDLGYPRWAFTVTADRLTNSDTPEGAAIIGSITLALWLLRQQIEAALILLSVPLHVLGNFPKALVSRARPGEVLDGANDFVGMKSFPSGHAEFAVTFYGFLVYVALLHVRSPAQRALLVGVWLVMALEVGFARMEVGKHWPLDVVGGYIVGIGLLSGLIWLHRSLSAALGQCEGDPSRVESSPSAD
jgi:undecaprenyl-diphosphatase